LAESNVETVLLKQLASCLAMPMFVLGPEGELLFFNESAEPIIGGRFEETGMLRTEEWLPMIQTTDESGIPFKDEQRPLLGALQRREPTYGRFFVQGFDGRHRRIEGTAIPLVDLAGRLLGALGIFWEADGGEKVGSAPSPAASHTRQYAVETILTQRLASKLAIPIFLADASGRLLYFNTAAEPLLGQSFEDFQRNSREGAYATFRPANMDGSLMKPEEHPMWIARVQCRPVHRRIRIHGLDGVERQLEVTAIPLIGQSGRMLGACGLFWEAGGGSSGPT